MYCM